MKYLDGNYYHMYNRGTNKQDIFFQPENYVHLIGLFEKYIEQYDVTVAAYCLMPNHYHLLTKQNMGGNLGDFLKTTFNAYSQAINRRFGRSGTLFQGQAKAKHVFSDEYCLQLVRYIHLNPVEARLVRLAEDWKYSNYLDWISKRESKLMDNELRNGYFSNGEKYKMFIEEYNDEKSKKLIWQFLFNKE